MRYRRSLPPRTAGVIAGGKIGATLPALVLGFVALIVAAAGFLAAGVGPAEALPSYARQTGQPCAACHTAFPELTPFGRRFKIGGYTAGGGGWTGPPIAAMYMAGFTHTQSPQDSPPAPGLHTNDNLASQQVSGFIAGQLYGNLGSFIQITGDPTNAGTAFVDASDVRYADTLKLFGKEDDLGHRRQQYADRGRPLEHDALVWLAADLLDHRAGVRAALDPYRERIWPDRRRRRRVRVLERHAVR